MVRHCLMVAGSRLEQAETEQAAPGAAARAEALAAAQKEKLAELRLEAPQARGGAKYLSDLIRALR